jgi:uncharacterized Ntn-hydrolase superfamily protein
MTFSIVARCPRTNMFGVVTCTTGRAVGNSVPHAEDGVGAIATQHSTNIFHGVNGLRLLKLGFEPVRVLSSTLELDTRPEYRQLLIIDKHGRTAAHTGSKNTGWCGHIEGDNYVVGGNDLESSRVLDAMKDTIEELSEQPLHERLVRAIDSGHSAGGCNTPDHTAALLVVGIEEELKLFYRPNLNLRVDWSKEARPTKDLLEMYANYKEWIAELRSQGTRHTVLY